MRITNKIMRNNSLYNLNQNKLLEDRLTNQMTNQSKIARPSDNPVVAIRALRLRSNVTYVSQYYDNNAKDADQWLNVTGDAMATIADILKDLYNKTTGSANKYLTSGDLDIYITQMKALTDEFYASGNVDYAGRYVFSGFRTDTAITFSAEDIAEMERHPSTYEITEKLGFENISSFKYTDYSTLSTDIGGDGIRGDGSSYEQAVTNNTMYRLRLSYNNLDAADGGDMKLSFKDNLGRDIAAGQITEYADAEEAYKAIANGTETGIAYIPSTGEMVFSESYYNDNFKEGNQFSVTYEKSEWSKGDVNPVHYFECVETRDIGNGETKTIAYNTDPTTQPQDIFYDVGFNQQIQVNTLATEVFNLDVRRDLDDFQRNLTQLRGIETELSDIEKEMAQYPTDSDEYKNLSKKKEAAEKAATYIREDLQTQFENQITRYQKYMDDANVANTDSAARGQRLALITTRLMNQKTTFKDLQTDNESIDVTQVAVEMSSAELTYQAALMATGKIMQTNLMNYI